MRDRIRTFILEELGWYGPPSELTDDYPLIEREVIDSMGLFRLVTFLEESGIEVADDDLVPDNFASLDAITALAARSSGVARP